MKLTGNTGFVEEPIEDKWSATSGQSYVRTWVGPKSGMVAFLTSTIPGGFTELTRYYSPTALVNSFVRIRAVYATTPSGTGGGTVTDPIITTWTLQGSEVQKHIMAHPKTFMLTRRNKSWPAKIEAHAKRYRANIKRMVELGQSIASEEPAQFSWAFADQSDAEMEWAHNLEVILCNDPDSVYEAAEYRLMKRQQVNSATTVVVAHLHVGDVLSTAALETSEPTLSATPAPPGRVLIGYAGLAAYKWHKKPAVVTETSRGRFEIAQSYLGVVDFDPYKYTYHATWPT